MSVLKSWGIKLKKEPKIEIIWCCPILCGDHACIQIIILEVTCFELFNEYVFQLAAASTIKIAWSPTLVVYSDRLLFNPLFMLSACLCRCLPLDYLPLTFLSSMFVVFIRVMCPLMVSYLACLFYCFTSSFYQQPLQDIYIWLLWLPWILYIQFFCMSKLSIQLSTCSFSMFLAIK